MGLILSTLWGFVSKHLLTAKGLSALAILAALGYSGYKAYDWSYSRGATHQASVDQKKLDKAAKALTEATSERDQAIKDKERYVASYHEWLETSKKASDQLIASQKDTIASLKEKLKVLPQIQKDNERLQDEVASYISSQADARCVLPRGFVELFNRSLQTGQTPSDSTLADSTRGALAEPSGVTCTTLVRILLLNNAEALKRGVIIEEWQAWYRQTKKAFDQAGLKSTPTPSLDTP